MQQSGLINRANYDPKVLSVFEIIGCYFVDTFYNSLFLKAREKTQLEGARSITDAYKSNIINYLRGVKGDTELYRHVVKQLCDYFRSATRYSTITFGEFEDKTVRCFIPQEYFNDLTERDKDSLLNVIILRIVEDFSIKVIKQEFLKMVIDDHSNRGNIDVLKNIITDIMILIRESYFEMFMKKIVDNGRKDRDKVDVEMVHKANKALAEEIKIRVKLEGEILSAKNVISGLLMKLKTMEGERDAAVADNGAISRELELKKGEIRALQSALESKQPRQRGRPRKQTYEDSDDDAPAPVAPTTAANSKIPPNHGWYEQEKYFDSMVPDDDPLHNAMKRQRDEWVDREAARKTIRQATTKFTPEGFNAPIVHKPADATDLKAAVREIIPAIAGESDSGSESGSDSGSDSGSSTDSDSETDKTEVKPKSSFDFSADDIGFGFD
ncbi:hypothetical protein F-E9_175 [Faustovirus]|nr:hypothetical protein F-E9_175 [Faustovirus]